MPCTVAVGRACLLCDQPTMAKGKAKSPTSKPTEVAAAVRTEAGAPVAALWQHCVCTPATTFMRQPLAHWHHYAFSSLLQHSSIVLGGC